MKSTSPIAVLALACGTAGLEGAEPVAPPATPPPVSAGLANDWLREQSAGWKAWDLGGQVRARLEHKRYFAAPGQPGAVDFAATGNPDNTYLLLREKVHVGYTPCDWGRVYAEGRDSSSHHDDRNPNPEADTFDLHQAYVAIGNLEEFPVSLKVGRQELIYGDERLVGAADWTNVGRVFDAAKVRYEHGDFWFDAFVGRVVISDDDNFNVANDYEWLSGAYLSSRTLWPKHEAQAYFLARNASVDSPTALGSGLPAFMNGATPRDIYTLGVRCRSLPGSFGPWDYALEAAGQVGRYRFGTGAATPSLEHEAYAAHVAGGYRWQDAWGAPRLALEYNFGSGDGDPADGDHTTFDNLYPTNHKFYGYMDFVAWQNVHNPRLSLALKPLDKLTATLDFHGFWLVDTADYFYQVNGAPRNTGGYGLRPQADSYVGCEVDVVLTYAVATGLAVQGGYGHFFAGSYVDDSLAAAGGSEDADYLYLQMTFNF